MEMEVCGAVVSTDRETDNDAECIKRILINLLFGVGIVDRKK